MKGKPKDLKKTVLRLLSYVGEYKYRLVAVLLCMLCTTTFSLIGGYMLAPIVNQGQKSRVVYLPEGKWVNYFTNEVLEGGKEYIVQMKLAETGLFIKAGAMIPMFANLLHIDKSKITNLHLYLAPGADESEYVHYEDDGETLDYQKGVYNEYHFIRKGNVLSMKMKHDGYASDYQKIVVVSGADVKTLEFAKELEVEL